MKILIVKSVFCPNKNYFNITCNSLHKVNNYIKQFDIKFDLLLIGWNSFNFDYDNLSFDSIFTEFWPINYGKAKIFNSCIDFVKNSKYKNLIYLDHDIYFDEYFDLKKISEITPKYGLVAFNHRMDCRHRPTIYINSSNFDELRIVWPNDDLGIASGAFIIDADKFRNLEYFELDSVYGLDDYHLCQQLTKQNYRNVVIANCYIIHPFDNNKEYGEWKKDNVKRMINNDLHYYRNIEESMNFFKGMK